MTLDNVDRGNEQTEQRLDGTQLSQQLEHLKHLEDDLYNTTIRYRLCRKQHRHPHRHLLSEFDEGSENVMCLLKTNLETVRSDVKRMLSYEKHCERSVNRRHKHLLNPLKSLDRSLRRFHCALFHLFEDIRCVRDSSTERGSASWRPMGGISRSECHKRQCSLAHDVRDRVDQLEKTVKNVILPTLTALSGSNEMN